MKYIVNKSKLSGEINSSPSKSHSLRAIMFASLANGKSTIRQDLALRAHAIQNGETIKAGVLIEGVSGIGKSTLAKTILKAHGFQKEATETQEKYHEISAGSDDAYGTLLTAFHKGSVVLLDEVNLDDRVEGLLNQLLSGVDLSGQSPQKPGFMVIATQNPVYFEGRKTLSSAFLNRFHMIYMDAYSSQELERLAEERVSESPRLFVQAYQETQGVNTRTFFHALMSQA